MIQCEYYWKKSVISGRNSMLFQTLKKYQTPLIIGCVGFFALFALWLRLLPMFTMGNTDILSMVASDDPLYNLRQVEQLLANFPTYAWYDPMNLIPSGVNVYWGPLFIYIGAIACMITGATTRPEIIATCLLIPPVMAAVVVILMYPVGKICGNWKTGLLASGFTAVVAGQFFFRSLYGYYDHHVGEVLFSTLFCLCYLYAILAAKDTIVDLKNFSSYKKVLLLSVLAGIAYLLDLFLMPTVILFALIVVVFTFVQILIDGYRNQPSDYLIVINGTCFIVAIIGLLAFGFKNSTGIELSTYSVGHVIAYILIIAGTILLFSLQRFFKNREKYLFPVIIIGIALLFAGVLYVIFPELFHLFITDLYFFFGQSSVTDTVEEARPWTSAEAWQVFNYGLLLLAGGAIALVYRNIKEERPEQIFVLIWSVIIFYSAWAHVRYEYYLAINVALLAALCVGFILDFAKNDLRRIARLVVHNDGTQDGTDHDDLPKRTRKSRKVQRNTPVITGSGYLCAGAFIMIMALAIFFVSTSFSYNYAAATSNGMQMNPDWKESLIWMGNNTPDPGLNYYAVYDKATFILPATAYGVMSWWDYGHMITYIAKRIPNANPFQEGITGSGGSATFFISTSEADAIQSLDIAKTRYIITDAEMDTGKFWAMATWDNSSAATAPYQMTLLVPGQSGTDQYQVASLNRQQYYLTMISRLHNFDGSLTRGGTAYYIEYSDPSVAHATVPVMTNAATMNASAAYSAAAAYNLQASAGSHAVVLSPRYDTPIADVPALQHFRLVHESPTSVIKTNTSDIKYVKTFEYVKGAHIKGTGIIEVPVVTNTGRIFTYRQESVNGEFIVPYSTTGSMLDVKTTGKYHISGTSQEFDVPESAVEQGLAIN
jgi:dolichyl-diphosphooligosaccharide--protein glycosyltransferase